VKKPLNRKLASRVGTAKMADNVHDENSENEDMDEVEFDMMQLESGSDTEEQIVDTGVASSVHLSCKKTSVIFGAGA
jgi:hypothetical protein